MDDEKNYLSREQNRGRQGEEGDNNFHQKGNDEVKKGHARKKLGDHPQNQNPVDREERKEEDNSKVEHSSEEEKKEEIVSKWMEGTGPDSDIVVSSRVRLARNVKGYPFPAVATKEQRKEIFHLAEKIIQREQGQFSRFSFLQMDSMPMLERQVLLEKHLISPLLVQEPEFSAFALRDDEVVSIMINEEDHFRLQCLLPGLQLEKVWEEINLYDDYVEEHVDYAFHEELGYLTSCPTNVGTGLRTSVMLHLPALVITQQIKSILSAVNQVGLAVRGIYGEGTEVVGSLFQMSNQITLGQSEEEIRQNLYGVTRQLIHQERMAREQLLNEGREKLADRAGRALGVLKHAHIISTQEAVQLISDVRLGVEMGLIKNIPVKVLNELLVLIRPASLQHLKGKKLRAYERDIERTVQIQKRLP